MFGNLFGAKQVPADEMVKEWRAKLRSEGHTVEREIRNLERSEENVKKEIKKLAKLGEMDSARMLAKVRKKKRRFCFFLLFFYFLFFSPLLFLSTFPGTCSFEKGERANVRNKGDSEFGGSSAF